MTDGRSIHAALLVAVAMALSPDAARADDRPVTLIRLWQDANSDCRGYPGESPRSITGCADREVYGRKLAAVGWCYGRQGEAGFQMQWHRCGPSSIRPAK